ncbi:MAG: 50S ribosomal protein L10 [SAR202 cluster bacterium Io17-Chloro-G9]|nr:MAG: 50S ribosomal protein L10 [SAR202 cluster bacterium Io17-Chloro-G9]
MPTDAKIRRVDDLKDRLERSSITVAADYTGISVNEMTDLRRRMREAGVDFTVVKNTLTYLASEAAGRPQVREIVQGPTVIAFGYDDPLNVARAISDYIRTTRSALSIRGAVMGDGPVLPPGDVTRMASLPPKPQLVATLLGQLQSPLQRLLGVLNGPLRNLDGVLQARIRQMESPEPSE